MKRWEQTLVAPETSLREALRTIDSASSHIALVVDANRRLLGTLSDGDARRGLLKGLTLDDPVSAAMHLTPTCASHTEDRHAILGTMRRLGLHQIPVLDERGRVTGLETVDDYLSVPEREHWVVIMAGGLGSRMAELTRDTPKPMLKVGSRPLLETIVRSYAEQGFKRFYFAVNYKADQIQAHFGDGSALGVHISYLREQKRLGTAGALGLLPDQPKLPFIVTNADLLTKEDYGRLLDQHQASGAQATMAVREFEMQVPFGVVRETQGQIQSLEEKPVQRFTVNAGIYVLSPQALELVPRDEFFDMPALFEALLARGMHARCHRVEGYWMDIGRVPDYERANIDFADVFQ